MQHIMDFDHVAEKTGFKSAQDLKRFFQENSGELFEFLYKENSQVPEIPVKK